MGKLKPIGSERLEGMEKINRIIEISRYKENIPTPVNEVKSTEYGIMLADGNTYKIERDKNGYVIKKSINESEMDYLEPMQNRKYYPSYSQALKRLNLITKEVNTLVGNEENISLFGEQKKFTLKTPKPAPVEAPPMPEPAPAPAPTDMPPAPDAGMDMPEDPSMGDEGMDMPEDPEGEEGMDMGDEDVDMPDQPEGEEGMVTFKSIQKLTGKLGQKIRKLNQGEEPISSDDTKYVINSILSALDLSQLSDEDVEEIMGRFEDNEDMGDEDMGDEDMDMPEEPEMGDEDMDTPEDGEEIPEGEMSEEWEGTTDGDYDLGFSDEPKKMRHPRSPMEEDNLGNILSKKIPSIYAGNLKKKLGEMGESFESHEIEGVGNIFDGVFSESKVDKILSKYFQESPNEKRLNEERGVRKFVEKKTHKVKQMKEVKRLSESIDQEVTSEKFITRYSKAELIGKTNKKNLVFEVNGKQFKITPDGAIL